MAFASNKPILMVIATPSRQPIVFRTALSIKSTPYIVTTSYTGVKIITPMTSISHTSVYGAWSGRYQPDDPGVGIIRTLDMEYVHKTAIVLKLLLMLKKYRF